jgi:phage repressor protein C with HTH and peptisase S24 domain
MRFPLGIYQVKGQSMSPTLSQNQRLIVNYWSKGKVGDLVVLKKEAKTMVKRIESIDGTHIYVKSDHPSGSGSHEFGALHASQILGKVLL